MGDPVMALMVVSKTSVKARIFSIGRPPFLGVVAAAPGGGPLNLLNFFSLVLQLLFLIQQLPELFLDLPLVD